MSHWFKFYGQEFLSDPKMLSLSAIERSLWLTMLCLASSSDEEGVIKYIDETKIMLMTNISPLDDEWQNTGFLAKFEELGMINVKDKVITLLNFNKRQETNLTNAERQARYRSNKGNVTKVTLEKNREDKKRIDKNIKEINKESSIESLTQEDFQQIAEDYRTTIPHVLSCLDDLKSYCLRSGRKYKDYKAALRHFVKTSAIERREHAADKSKISFIDPA